MKKYVGIIAFMVIVGLVGLTGCVQTNSQVLRLHIVANSDSEIDQEAKLAIRDELLASYRDVWEQCSNVEECIAVVDGELVAIEAKANAVLREKGMGYQVHAETGVFAFPTRMYADVSWPAGNYPALRLVLGSGEGKNWWCVLYPPLCVVGDGQKDAKKTQNNTKSKPQVKSWLWERVAPKSWQKKWDVWFGNS